MSAALIAWSSLVCYTISMKAALRPGTIAGRIAAPASKSHTIRAFAAALLVDGVSVIDAPLVSHDTERAIAACRACGGRVVVDGSRYVVHGVGGDVGRVGGDVARGGDGDVARSGRHIDVGNSGTTLRLFTAIAALSAAEWRF